MTDAISHGAEISPAGESKKFYSGNTNLIIQTKWCNIFGGENDGGAKAVLGGIGPQQPQTVRREEASGTDASDS